MIKSKKDQTIDKEKFHSLSPEILDEIPEIHKKALDYALLNLDYKNDLHNIALTGKYGSGKSSLLKTYFKKNNIKNIIYISLGNYKLEDKKQEFDENRLENQIINQMSSQVKSSYIPLSKYKYEKVQNKFKLILKLIFLLFFVISILFFALNDKIIDFFIESQELIINKNLFIYLGISLIIFPVCWFCYWFLNVFKVSITKLKIKWLEVKVLENGNDFTIFDRDLREIIYILTASKARYVVFEDLDRFSYSEIFIKLREINFIINKYLSFNKYKRDVKFIYLVKDGIFDNSTRTKFFDFIIPVLPIVQNNTSIHLIKYYLNIISESSSSSSEPKTNTKIETSVVTKINGETKTSEESEISGETGINNGNKENEKKLNNSYLHKISLYLNDPRIIKNIANEFLIYKNIINFQLMKTLDENILFSLIVVKHLFPKQFDDLQENNGIIYNLINEIEYLKKEKNVEILERESIDKIFTNDNKNFNWTDNQEIKGLLRFLADRNYLCYSYFYYINSIDAKKFNVHINNEIFLKSIIEKSEAKTLLKLSDIGNLVERYLEEKDFSIPQILNVDILNHILKPNANKNYSNKIRLIFLMIKDFQEYNNLSKIIIVNNNDESFLELIVNNAFKAFDNRSDIYDFFIDLLKTFEEDKSNEQNKLIKFRIIINFFKFKKMEDKNPLIHQEIDKLNKIVDFIDDQELFLEKIEANELLSFCEKINKTNCKFEIKDKNLDEEKIKIIFEKNVYKFDFETLKKIFLFNKEYSLKNFLDYIYDEKNIVDINSIDKKIIANVFKDYLEEISKEGISSNNSFKYIEKILFNNFIEKESKKDYLEINDNQLEKLEVFSKWNDYENINEKQTIIDYLIKKGKIKYDYDNSFWYIENLNVYNLEIFTLLVDKIKEEDIEKLINKSQKFNILILSTSCLGDDIFDKILLNNKGKDLKINIRDEVEISQERIFKLVDNNLLEYTKNNLEILMKNNFYKIFTNWLENDLYQKISNLLWNNDLINLDFFDNLLEDEKNFKLILDKIEEEVLIKILNSNFLKKESIKRIVTGILEIKDNYDDIKIFFDNLTDEQMFSKTKLLLSKNNIKTELKDSENYILEILLNKKIVTKRKNNNQDLYKWRIIN